MPALTRLLSAELARLRFLAVPLLNNPIAVGTKDKEVLQGPEPRRDAHPTSSTSPPTKLPPDSPISSLPYHLSSRLTTLRENQITRLPAAQRTLFSSISTYLAASTASLERSIRLLSRNKHGTAARAQKARAEALSMHAACVLKQATICNTEVASKVYDAEALNALKTYQMHLEDLLTQLSA